MSNTTRQDIPFSFFVRCRYTGTLAKSSSPQFIITYSLTYRYSLPTQHYMYLTTYLPSSSAPSAPSLHAPSYSTYTYTFFFTPTHHKRKERERGKKKTCQTSLSSRHTQENRRKVEVHVRTCTYLWVHVLTSLARHVVLAGIGAGAGRDRLMSGIYNWYMYIRYCTFVCIFVHLYGLLRW